MLQEWKLDVSGLSVRKFWEERHELWECQRNPLFWGGGKMRESVGIPNERTYIKVNKVTSMIMYVGLKQVG